MTFESAPHQRHAVVALANSPTQFDHMEIAVVLAADGEHGDAVVWIVHSPDELRHSPGRSPGTGPDDAFSVAGDVRAHLDGAVFVAHDVPQTLRALASLLPGFHPTQVADTLAMARSRWPDQPSYQLAELSRALQLSDGETAEKGGAGVEAVLTARLLMRLQER